MTPDQETMSALAKTVFALNARFVLLGEGLARPAGLTAARWQVLGGVLQEPRSVADLARGIGVTRQSVQRVADLLVAEGLAEYRPNPAHRRAKLLAPTEAGRAAVRRIRPGHAILAERLTTALGAERLRGILGDLAQLSEALDELAT